MLEALDQWDRAWLITLNGWNSPFWDRIMLFVTDRHSWYPLYAAIIGLLVWQYKRDFWIPLVTLLFLALFTDLVSTQVFKEGIQRLRPCQVEDLKEQIRILTGCGGKFGFFSSHASNTFAMGMFLILLWKRKTPWVWLFLPWAGIISYSRIYVGKHYPLDVITGMIFGLVSAYLFYKIVVWSWKKWSRGGVSLN